jgi:hypothetical protein
LACNREFTELSHGCESVVEALRVFNTLTASLSSPTITMGTLTAFISTLTAASATVSRPLVALSRAIHYTGTSTLTASTALLWPLQTLSCEILPTFLQNTVYIFTTHIVQKHFLMAMRGLLEAMRVLLEAVIVLLEAAIVLFEAVRMFVKSVRAHVKA